MKTALFPICLGLILSVTGCDQSARSPVVRYQCYVAEMPHPKTSDELAGASRRHYYLEEYSCAYTAAEEAVYLQPNNSRALVSRGLARLGLKDLSAALKDFNLALKVPPENYEAYLGRSIVFAEAQDLDRALEEISQAIEVAASQSQYQSEVPYLLNQRGHLHLKNGNQGPALEDFSEAIARKPEISIFYEDRARLYREMDKVEEALADEQKSVNLEFNGHQKAAKIKVRGSGLL